MHKKKKLKTNKISKFFSNFLVCIIVLLIGLITLKSNPNLRDKFYKSVFQNNLKFAKINELYEKYFGSSLPLKGSKNNLSLVSSNKLEYKKEEKYKNGVKLQAENNYAIPVLKSGIVIFTGEKEGYGKTIIIQSADDVEVWYSNLKDIKVNMYDYLKEGSIVGEANNDNFILEFNKNGKALNYKKYI